MKVTVNFAAAAIGLSLALAIPQPAWSNIKNVVDLGAGNLSFDYGSNGFGNLTAWYVVQSGTVGSSGVAGATGLSFTAHTSPSLPLSASGTPQLLITYDLTNTT